MTKIKAIVVDDEQHACDFLRKLILSNCPEVEVMGTANRVDDAVLLINSKKPDLVFLDIEMPDGNGLSLFDKNITHRFDVIFTTAHPEYAMQAYRVAALHYLLKPIDADELKEAIHRFNKKKENYFLQERIGVLQENYNNLVNHSRQIALKVNNDYQVLSSNDIICVTASQSYIEIYCVNKERPLVIVYTLSNFCELLPIEDFLRIHRSQVINKNYIESFDEKAQTCKLKNGLVLDIAKANKKWFLENFTKW